MTAEHTVAGGSKKVDHKKKTALFDDATRFRFRISFLLSFFLACNPPDLLSFVRARAWPARSALRGLFSFVSVTYFIFGGNSTRIR